MTSAIYITTEELAQVVHEAARTAARNYGSVAMFLTDWTNLDEPGKKQVRQAVAHIIDWKSVSFVPPDQEPKGDRLYQILHAAVDAAKASVQAADRAVKANKDLACALEEIHGINRSDYNVVYVATDEGGGALWRVDLNAGTASAHAVDQVSFCESGEE